MEKKARPQQVLLVDDEEKLLESIARRMKLLGFDALKATNGSDAVDIARRYPLDLAIVDLQMPGMDGLATIAKLKEVNPRLKTILLTGHGNEKVRQATESLDSTYFEKDEMGDFWKFINQLNAEGKVVVIRPAASAGTRRGRGGPAAEIQIHSERPAAAKSIPDAFLDRSRKPAEEGQRPVIIGETAAMQDLRKNIDRVAGLDCAVIIRGETGTGKELAARAIHAKSKRQDRRFLAINCSYLSSGKMLAQFLGYRHGDLSEAVLEQGGVFGLEPGGTLLFENVADLSEELQLQLLKILDSTEGSRQYNADGRVSDLRVLIATDTDLLERVDAGKFRKDLYYRLNLFELSIPPLRERKDDIAPLCSYFVNKYRTEFHKSVAGISQEVIETFMRYDFPGNVRELQHIIERAVIIADGRNIEKRHLPARFQGERTSAKRWEGDQQPLPTLAEVEMRYIMEVLEASGGNKTRTAEILGISRAALWRKLKQVRTEAPDR